MFRPFWKSSRKPSGLVVFFFKNPTQQVLLDAKNFTNSNWVPPALKAIWLVGFFDQSISEKHVIKVPSSFFHKNQQPSLFNHHLTWDLPKVPIDPQGVKLAPQLEWGAIPYYRIVIHPSRWIASFASFASFDTSELSEELLEALLSASCSSGDADKASEHGSRWWFFFGRFKVLLRRFSGWLVQKKNRGSKWGFLSGEIFFPAVKPTCFLVV